MFLLRNRQSYLIEVRGLKHIIILSKLTNSLSYLIEVRRLKQSQGDHTERNLTVVPHKDNKQILNRHFFDKVKSPYTSRNG